jgi:HEAT repeat protein
MTTGRGWRALLGALVLAAAGWPAAGAAQGERIATLLQDGRVGEAYAAAVPDPATASPERLAEVARIFLGAALTGHDSYQRWFALRALRAQPDADLAPLIVPLAASEDRYVQSLALEFLAGQNPAAHREVFIAALRSPHHTIRLRGLRGLATIRDASAVEPVIGVLRGDADPELRALAARRLGESGAPAAVPALEAALDDGAEMVQIEAVRALVALRAATVAQRLRRKLAAAAPGDRARLLRQIALVRDPTLAAAVAPYLADENPEVRALAGGAVLAVQLPPAERR